MDLMDMLRALGANGIGLLEACHGMCRADIISAGLSSSRAGSWLRIADVFFGRTAHSQQQREARELAAAGGLSVAALEVIEKQVNNLLTGDRWALRVELCSLRGTVDEIAREAEARVRALNRGNEDKAVGKRALKGGKNTDAKGCRTFTVTGPERHIAAFLSGIELRARKLRRSNPGLTYEQAMYDSLLSGGGTVRETLTPHVVIGLPDWAKLLREEGDDCVFALTDGTTITGAELVTKLSDDYHVVGLYSPVEGPINLYRAERLASPKQVALLNADSILCEWPECTTAVEQCQTHHIDAWKRGGFTNLSRMTRLCKKHNGDNDDDPDAPPLHGRVDRVGGQVVWSDGKSTRVNRHPIKRISARGLISGQ